MVKDEKEARSAIKAGDHIKVCVISGAHLLYEQTNAHRVSQRHIKERIGECSTYQILRGTKKKAAATVGTMKDGDERL